MNIKDGLHPEIIKKLNAITLQEKLTTAEWKEKLSEKDLADLMGINRQIYVRKNGAIRRK